MADEQKPGNFANNSLIIAALISLCGLIAAPFPSLRGERPPASFAQTHNTDSVQNVDARLWQDPFSVLAHADETQCIDSSPADSYVTLWVTMSGAPYSAEEEERRRFRYAVVSALDTHGFAPSDEVHLGCYRSSINGLKRIPFEIFEEKPPASLKSKVRVVWIDEAALRGKLPSMIKKLTGEIWPNAVIGPQTSPVFDELRKNLSGDVQCPNEREIKCIPFYAYGATKAPEGNIAESSTGNVFRTIANDGIVAEALKRELKLRGVDPCNKHDQLVVTISELDTSYGRSLWQSVRDKLFDGDKCKEEIEKRFLHRSFLRGLDGESAEANLATQASGNQATSNKQATSGATDKEAAKRDSDDKTDEKPFGSGQRDYLRRLAQDLKRQQAAERDHSIAAIGVLGSDVFDKLMIFRALRPEFPNALFFTTDYDAALGLPSEHGSTHNVIIASSFGPELRRELQGEIPPFRDVYETSVFLATQIAILRAQEPQLSIAKAVAKLIDNKANAAAAGTETAEQKWSPRPRIFEIMRTGDLLELPPAPQDDPKTSQSSAVQPKWEPLYPAQLDWLIAPALMGLIYFTASVCGPRWRENMPGVYDALRIIAMLLIMSLSVYGLHKLSFFAFANLYVPAVFFLFVIASWSLLDKLNRETYHGFIKMFWPVVALLVSLGSFIFWIFWNPETGPNIAEFLTEQGLGEPMSLLGGVSVWPVIILRSFALLLSIWLILLAFCQLEENFEEEICIKFGMTGPKWSSVQIIKNYKNNHPSKIAWLSLDNFYRIAPKDSNYKKSYTITDNEWFEIVMNAWTPHRISRIIYFWTVVAIVGIGGLFHSFGLPVDRVRGDIVPFYGTITYLNVVAMWFLIFLVVDATLFLCLFVWRLSRSDTIWPSDAREQFNVGLGLHLVKKELPNPLLIILDEILNDWIDIQFIANRTSCINKLVWYPLAIISLMIVARSGLFANFPLSWPIVIAQGAGLLLIFTCAFALNWCAEDQRKRAKKHLSDAILLASSSSHADLAKKLECMLDRVTNLNEGSFRNFIQQPVFSGMLLPLASIGGSQIIQQSHLFGL